MKEVIFVGIHACGCGLLDCLSCHPPTHDAVFPWRTPGERPKDGYTIVGSIVGEDGRLRLKTELKQ